MSNKTPRKNTELLQNTYIQTTYNSKLKHLALSYNIGWEKLVGTILQRCDFCGFNSRFKTNDDGSHDNFNDDDDDHDK